MSLIRFCWAAGILLSGIGVLLAQETLSPESLRAEPFFPTIHAIRQAGLKRDTSMLPDLIRRLQQTDSRFTPEHKIGIEPGSFYPDVHYRIALLTAIARVGNAESMDSLKAAEGLYRQWGLYDIWRVCFARLSAEVAFPKVPDLPTAEAKVAHFLQVAQVSEASLAHFAQTRSSKSATQVFSADRYLLRHLLEMLARANPAYARHWLTRHGISLETLKESDYPAWLCLHLAGLPDAERVEWLLRQLSERSVRDACYYYELQALSDSGQLGLEQVVQAITKVISETPTESCSRSLPHLLDALVGFSGSKVEDLLAQLVSHSDAKIRQEAKRALRYYRWVSARAVFASDW